jgi:invasion protein IalB
MPHDDSLRAHAVQAAASGADARNGWICERAQPIMPDAMQDRTMPQIDLRRAKAIRRCAAFYGAVALAGLAAGLDRAQAQDPVPWRVECTGDGKTLDCRAVQQLFQRESRQLVVGILARKGSDPKSAQLMIQLPLGLNLTEPVLIKVDNGQPERQSIQTCTNIGCFVSMAANDKFVAAMRSGTEIKITVQDANKKPIEVAVPLLGFGIAFDKARS